VRDALDGLEPGEADEDVLVCQHEAIPLGYRMFEQGDTKLRTHNRMRPVLDSFTRSIVADCLRARRQAILYEV
jgi:hypothetical protein